MAEEPRAQRTEKPTPRRLKKARDQGRVARSPEIPTTLVLLGFVVFGELFGGEWLNGLLGLMKGFLGRLHEIALTTSGFPSVMSSIAMQTGLLILPPLGVLAAAGLAGNLVQGPPPFSAYPLKPKFEKLNPIRGLKKIVSLKQWVEMLKGLLKMTLYGAVAFHAVREVILNGSAKSPGAAGTFDMLASLVGTVIWRVAAVAAGLAVLDYLFRRYDHTRDLKMTKKQVRDDMKETEGDPLIRSRIRQKQTAMARSRMMSDVPNATIVVTNPVHIAVALRYVAGETDAPQLLAKGKGLLAKRIREIARAHDVPIVSDPPLARSLYRSVAVGGQIPQALFRAVAEVLALVLSGGRRRARTPHLEGSNA